MMDTAEIQRWLPHRHPFLMVDRIVSIEPGVRATGEKDVGGDEFWVQGHFPGNPVLPGVLITEALAQVAAIVAITAHPDLVGQPVYLVGTDKMRFRRIVRPGEVLRLEVSVTDKRRRMWFFDAKATVNGERTADGSFLATIPEPR